MENVISGAVPDQVLLNKKQSECSEDTAWLLQARFATANYDSLLLKEHVPKTEGS